MEGQPITQPSILTALERAINALHRTDSAGVEELGTCDQEGKGSDAVAVLRQLEDDFA